VAAKYNPLVRTSGRVLITSVPYCEIDRKPIELLESHRIPFDLNPKGRKLKEKEILEIISPYEALIAGTEPLTSPVLEAAESLRLIARVGIGLDSVALAEARRRGIAVTYTPDAPTVAVAELTIAQMLALLRYTTAADAGLRQGAWRRWIGKSLNEITIGIIGVGRVGRAVLRRLKGWDPARILLNDLVVDECLSETSGYVWTNTDTIYRESDVITLHVPLTPQTKNMVGARELAVMKPDAILINMSRGNVIDEPALIAALHARPRFSAAIDVFADEPYLGELRGLPNCLLSCHMGSATRGARLAMELGATAEVIRYFAGEPPLNAVPETEYLLQE
jgi:D-3-phosphoglycerate dehydrogenase / 2-oxoglutarate reductase